MEKAATVMAGQARRPQEKNQKERRRSGMDFLTQGILAITWKQVVMFVIGGLLIWLALKKQMEPALLLPMGFGAILVNLPFSGALNQTMEGAGEVQGIIDWLFEVGIRRLGGHAAAALYRHRRDDRFWPCALQPQNVAVWRGGPVRYLPHHYRGGVLGL